MPTHIVTVLYPAGAKFNMEYYLQNHMPLVQKLWGPEGLKSWRVAQFTNAEAPFMVQAWLEWESAELAEQGLNGTHSGAIFGDVPNFSDAQPVLLTGGLAGTASW